MTTKHMTDAQNFIATLDEKWSGAATRGRIELAGGVRTGRFEENQFFRMPDGSQLILSDSSGGHRLVRAAP